MPSTGCRRCPGGPLRPPTEGRTASPRFQVRPAWPTSSRKLEGRRLGLPFCGRRSSHRRAHRRAMRLLIVATLSLPLAMLSFAEQGGAQASPVRVNSLQSQLERLNQQADQLVEQYLQAKLQLQHTQGMLSELRSDAQQAAQVLQDAQGRLGAKKRQVDQTVSRTEELLAQVKAADRAKLLAAANNGSSSSSSSGGSTPVSFPKVAASGGAAKAVAYAKAQVGKPYSYGGTGPGSFDCSGLTMMAWAQAGVSLPHSSSAQYSATRRVSAGELQPGDLIFYYSPISHVAIYVGGGMQVAATHTGDYVRLQALHTGITGYGRPGG